MGTAIGGLAGIGSLIGVGGELFGGGGGGATTQAGQPSAQITSPGFVEGRLGGSFDRVLGAALGPPIATAGIVAEFLQSAPVGFRRRDVARRRRELEAIIAQDFPRTVSPGERLRTARELLEGVTTIGGADINALGLGIFSPRGMRLLRGESPDVFLRAERGELSLEEVIDLVEGRGGAENFKLDFRKALRESGVIVGDRLAGEAFSRDNLQNLREGLFPAARGARERLTRRALSQIGVAPEPGEAFSTRTVAEELGEFESFQRARERSQDFLNFDPFGRDADDPFVVSELERLQQQIRQSFTARGLGAAGAAAALEGTEGVRLLEGIGQARRAEGLATLGELDRRGLQNLAFAQQMALGQFGGPTTLAEINRAFGQQLGTGFLGTNVETAFQGQELAAQGLRAQFSPFGSAFPGFGARLTGFGLGATGEALTQQQGGGFLGGLGSVLGGGLG